MFIIKWPAWTVVNIHMLLDEVCIILSPGPVLWLTCIKEVAGCYKTSRPQAVSLVTLMSVVSVTMSVMFAVRYALLHVLLALWSSICPVLCLPVTPEKAAKCSAICHCEPSDAHCCHMGTAIKHPVPDWVKASFVIFDIRAFWCWALSVRVPGCQKLQIPVWCMMLYSCTHMATVDVKGLKWRLRMNVDEPATVSEYQAGTWLHTDDLLCRCTAAERDQWSDDVGCGVPAYHSWYSATVGHHDRIIPQPPGTR